MKRAGADIQGALDEARQELRTLITQAAAATSTPSSTWIERVSALEGRIFSLEQMRAATS